MAAPEKRPAHRPPFKPTDEQRKHVEQLSAFGIPQEAMCDMLGITDKTLRKHFKRELRIGGPKANAKVAGSLFKKAMSGDTASAIFWLKTRAGWKEPVAAPTDSDGNVLIPVLNVTFPAGDGKT
jgi:hypothetical protein